MKIKILLIGLTSLLSACVSRRPTAEWTPAQVTQRRVIIFVPGLYGTALADSDGTRIFQTLGQGLWGIPLAFSGPELGISGTRELKPDGLLDQVNVIPLLYSVDGYGQSFDYLNEKFGDRDRVIAFPYDWRQENSVAAAALGSEVRRLRAAGATSIALVGHSLGGILIAYYLRYGEQNWETAVENWEGAKQVDVAVIAASPFRGAMTSFHDLLNGTSLGVSKTPLSAVSLGSFPSFFEFLPPVQLGEYQDSGLAPIGEPIYDAVNWKIWKAGLFHDTEGVDEKQLERRAALTEKNLRMGDRFSFLMNQPSKNPNPHPIPTLVVTARGIPTLARAVLQTEETSSPTWLFDDEAAREPLKAKSASLAEDGDGLVTVASARPPEALVDNLKIKKVTVNMPHRGMFTREELQEKVTAFLKGQGF